MILGAILMAWPAFYSGFPLMYPDSLEYIEAGRPVAAALLLGHHSSYYGIRSLIYSLGILPFHPGETIWPIIAFQCLLTSWVLWLVFRSVAPEKSWIHFLILMAPLSLFSSLSWFGSFVMPDILGPDLYLCIFLLVFTHESLSRAERTLVYLTSWWSITSHATHLLIAVALCCSLAVIAVSQPMPLRRYTWIAARLATIIALAAGAQISLNAFLYGTPSLNGDRRQARDEMALDFFYRVHRVAVISSLVGIAVLLPWLFRSRRMPLIALGFVIASSIVANSLFTGTLSMVAGRYGSRVVWLVPFFSGLCFLQWASDRRKIINARTSPEQP